MGMSGASRSFLTSDRGASSRFSSNVSHRTLLLAGEPGTAQTISAMRELIDDATTDPEFVRFAVDMVRGVPAYHDIGEVQAVYEWVKRNIRFTKDPILKEKLYPPRELLKIRAGDCDDISMLIAALLFALGYPARLVTIAADPNQPSEFSHVYVEAEIPAGSNQWVAVDAARSDSQFGVEPPNYFRKRAWSLMEDSYQDLSGVKNFVHANIVGRERNRRTMVSGLGSYGAVRGSVGNNIVPWAGSASSSPYVSFRTQFTPGHGLPRAGYSGRSLNGLGFDWDQLFQEVTSAVPSIVKAATGTNSPTTSLLPTSYTTTPSVSVASSSSLNSMLPLVVVALLAFSFMGGRR